MEENSNAVINADSGSVKEMINVAVPMVVSSACETVMMFTDRLFLSRLGSEHMSAAMGGGLSAFMVMSFFVGLLGYSTAVTAQYFGRGEGKLFAKVTYQALLIAFAAYPLLLIITPGIVWLFEASGLAQPQLVQQVPYFKILMFGSVLGLIRGVFSAFFSGIGYTRVVMIASLIAMVCNIIFSYVLIFGKFGIPSLGIVGAGIGTILGMVISVLILVFVYIRYLRSAKIQLSYVIGFEKDIFKKIVKFGLPAGMELFLNMSAFTLMVTAFQVLSLESSSAITIVFNWDHVAFIPLIGLEIGVTSLFGRYIGARREDIAHRSLISGIKTGTVFSLIVAFFFMAFPGALVDVFAPAVYDPAFESIREKAVFMLRIASIYVTVNAIIIVYGGALRGAGDTYMAMFITVGIMWFLTIVTFIILHVFHMSVETAWITLVAIFFFMPGFLYARYRSGAWRKKLAL
ncbi:MAG: MATE family efflux transporter [Deferribacterales bacterium]